MKRKSLIWTMVVLAVAVMFVFTACQQTTRPVHLEESALSGKVTLIGSTSVQPLAEDLSIAFMDMYPDVQVDVQGGGSSVGIQSVMDGLCDIGDASRNLKEEEKGKGLVEHVVALDGIAVVVHPSNTAADLTVEQVKQIYEGDITNWKDAGGADAEIIVLTREAASGTRGAFIELVGLEEEVEGEDVVTITEEALESNSNGALKTNVSTKENAIGYVSLGSIDDTVKALKVDGVDATAENVKNGTYGLFRPFLMLTNGEPQGVVKIFLDYVLGDGQAIVSENYISVD